MKCRMHYVALANKERATAVATNELVSKNKFLCVVCVCVFRFNGLTRNPLHQFQERAASNCSTAEFVLFVKSVFSLGTDTFTEVCCRRKKDGLVVSILKTFFLKKKYIYIQNVLPRLAEAKDLSSMVAVLFDYVRSSLEVGVVLKNKF